MNSYSQGKNYAKVVAKAWKDERFRAELLANPREVLEKYKVDLPEGANIIIDEGGTEFIWDPTPRFVIPLPPEPTGIGSDDLNDMAFAAIRCCCPPES